MNIFNLTDLFIILQPCPITRWSQIRKWQTSSIRGNVQNNGILLVGSGSQLHVFSCDDDSSSSLIETDIGFVRLHSSWWWTSSAGSPLVPDLEKSYLVMVIFRSAISDKIWRKYCVGLNLPFSYISCYRDLVYWYQYSEELSYFSASRQVHRQNLCFRILQRFYDQRIAQHPLSVLIIWRLKLK